MGVFLFEAQRINSATGQQGWLDLNEGLFCGFLHNLAVLPSSSAFAPSFVKFILGSRTTEFSACQSTRITLSAAKPALHDLAPGLQQRSPVKRHPRERTGPASYRNWHENSAATIPRKCTSRTEPAPNEDYAKNRRKRHALFQDTGHGPMLE